MLQEQVNDDIYRCRYWQVGRQEGCCLRSLAATEIGLIYNDNKFRRKAQCFDSFSSWFWPSWCCTFSGSVLQQGVLDFMCCSL